MFGLDKKKKFEQHQKLLYQCQHFGEFALDLAEENANADQTESWQAKLSRITKVRDGSLCKDCLIDKNDEFFFDALRDKCEEVYYKTEISK